MTSFEKLFEYQKQFQNLVWKENGYYGKKNENKQLPCDDVNVASYHTLALSEELGEVLRADKRWKNYRNEQYDKENKLEELSDCLLCILNIAMHSDINGLELYTSTMEKIQKNIRRVEDGNKKQ